MRNLLWEVGTKMDLAFSEKSSIRTRVWEDNNGALRLATNPNKISLRTKHLAIKYHFFCQHLSEEIQVLKVNTKDQLTDIFTKGLTQDTFQHLAAWLMGWVPTNLGREPPTYSQPWTLLAFTQFLTPRMRGSEQGVCQTVHTASAVSPRSGQGKPVLDGSSTQHLYGML